MNDLVTNIVLRDASQSKTINRFITLLSLTMVLRFMKFDIWTQGNHRESLRGSTIWDNWDISWLGLTLIILVFGRKGYFKALIVGNMCIKNNAKMRIDFCRAWGIIAMCEWL